MPKIVKRVSLSLNAWANQIGIESDTIERWAAKAGISIKPGTDISARTMFRIVRGEERSERTRLLRAQSEKVERENTEAIGQLIPLEAAKEKYLEILMAVRRDLEADYKAQGRLEVLDAIFKKHHAKG